MAHLDRESLAKLAELARIAISLDEEERLLKDLGKILRHVERLTSLDTSGAPPFRTVLPELVNVMCEDEVGEVLSRADFLANAPAHIGGMIRVPPILKQS